MSGLLAAHSGIKLLAMDVDGTLTDGRIYIGAEGEQLKAFDVKDGLGIASLLPEMGILPVVITGRSSCQLERRCAELGIKELHQGVSDKLDVLNGIAERKGAALSAVAYIGDDVNDLACMRAVAEAGGLVGCPSDAVSEVIAFADFVSAKGGGHGAVREFIEWLMQYDRGVDVVD